MNTFKQKDEKNRHGFRKKLCRVNIPENEKIVIVLQSNDSIVLFQDESGIIYPEQFKELYIKNILKDNEK